MINTNEQESTYSGDIDPITQFIQHFGHSFRELRNRFWEELDNKAKTSPLEIKTAIEKAITYPNCRTLLTRYSDLLNFNPEIEELKMLLKANAFFGEFVKYTKTEHLKPYESIITFENDKAFFFMFYNNHNSEICFRITELNFTIVSKEDIANEISYKTIRNVRIVRSD